MAYTREVLERRRQRERLDAVLAGLPVEAEEEAPLELSGEIGQLTGGNSLAGLGRLRAPDPRDRQYLLQRPRSPHIGRGTAALSWTKAARLSAWPMRG
jgi:hypothetical protein